MNKNPKITAIGGSIEENSSTFMIMKFAVELLISKGADVTVIDIKDIDLPLYSYSKGAAPSGKKLMDFIEALHKSDGYLFASPEYHGTVSAAFKNVIDYFEFLSGFEPPYLSGKPVGLIAAAGADNAGYYTLQTMINIVHSLRGIVVPSSIAVGSANKQVNISGGIINESLVRKLNRLAEEVFDLSSALNQNKK